MGVGCRSSLSFKMTFPITQNPGHSEAVPAHTFIPSVVDGEVSKFSIVQCHHSFQSNMGVAMHRPSIGRIVILMESNALSSIDVKFEKHYFGPRITVFLELCPPYLPYLNDLASSHALLNLCCALLWH